MFHASCSILYSDWKIRGQTPEIMATFAKEYLFCKQWRKQIDTLHWINHFWKARMGCHYTWTKTVIIKFWFRKWIQSHWMIPYKQFCISIGNLLNMVDIRKGPPPIKLQALTIIREMCRKSYAFPLFQHICGCWFQ